MSDEERNEDLNPRSDEIEKKIDAMLDPSIPDVPDLGSVPEQSPDEQPEKVVVIKSAPSKAKSINISAPPTAPELPTVNAADEASIAPAPPSTKSSKKVIIPIDHHDDAPETAPDPLLENAPQSQLAKEKVVKPINKITIQDHEESPEQVAEKLDEAIAELDPTEATSTQTTEAKPASAPELDGVDDIANIDEAKLQELSAESEEKISELSDTTAEESVEPIVDPEIITDPKTDKAVAEIVASEGDEILEIEDAVRDTDEPVEKPKKPKRSFGKALGALLRKPAVRWSLILLLVFGGTAAAAVPSSRYLVLNTAGVRVNSSLTVLDDSTSQPLKNVEVKIGDVTGTTDDQGRVVLTKVKLGSNTLAISKRAFAPYSKTVVLGWGSNPLGDFSLKPTGTQYGFTVSDFLSGKVLDNVAASSGQSDAQSDEKGVIKLTIDKPADNNFTVSFKLDGYRTEDVNVSPDDTSDHAVKLVPAKKHTYISKRSGKYDVYTAYIDGKDEKLVLAGSGNERDDMVLVPHPKDDVVAYVSTRPGQKNSDGFVLSNLIVINTEDGSTNNVSSSEQIKIISWAGDRLVYVQIAAGASADTPDRYRLISYNYKDGSSKELAKSNFYNDVIGIGSTVYYAPSSAYQAATANIYRVNADGTNKETIYDKEVWNIIRTNYEHLALSVQQQWYDYRIGDKQPTKLNTAPADQISRVYIDSLDGKHAVWVDNRDGKGVLISYDTTAKTEKTLRSEGGLGYPLRWVSDTVIVYRVKTAQQTADYAISLDGGEPVKINDVTNSAGLTRWLY